MKRRALLRVGSLGLLSAFAGCQSRPGTTSDPTATTDGTTTAAETTTGTADASIRDPVARESVIVPLTDTLAVAGADAQYAFATVEADGAHPPKPGDFALRLDGERATTGTYYVGPVSPTNPRGMVIRGLGEAYAPSMGTARGWVGFVLPPTVDAESGSLVLDASGSSALPSGVSTDLPEDALADLTAPAPDFSLDTLGIERRNGGDAFTVRLTVSNRGGRDETFRGCVNVAVAASTAIEIAVPAGESKTWTHSLGGDAGGTVSVDTVAGGTEKKLGR